MRLTSGLATGLMAAAILTGCDQGLKQENQNLKQQVTQATAVSAEKDSLLQLVVENTKLMTDINNELSRVKDLRSGVMPVTSGEGGEANPVDTRTYLLARVKEVTDRVNESESRLAASQRRSRSLTGQVAEFQKTVANLQAMIDTQKVTLATMTERINDLEATNVRLVAVNDTLQQQGTALRDTVGSLVSAQNTVYYTIGTKHDLLDRGVVVEEGSKFLFFGSKTLQPARHLSESDFQVADLRNLSEILLPDSTKEYKIVSRQNIAALTPAPDTKGRIRGSNIAIADPQSFWGPSRYLIIVQN